MLDVWLPLLLCIFTAAAWVRVLRLRERAMAHARELCTRHGLQLLDDSVALHRLRLRWRHGSLQALREYRFETSPGGHDRQTATLTLLGDRIVGTSLPSSEPPAAVAATPTRPSLPGGPLAADDDSKVVPINRIRRTLH